MSDLSTMTDEELDIELERMRGILRRALARSLDDCERSLLEGDERAARRAMLRAIELHDEARNEMNIDEAVSTRIDELLQRVLEARLRWS